MRLVCLLIFALSLIKGVDLEDATFKKHLAGLGFNVNRLKLLENTSLNGDLRVLILQEMSTRGVKTHALVLNQDNTQVSLAKDFLKRATPKQKAFIQARQKEARALEATPPKITHLFKYEGNVALLSLKPLPGTPFQIAFVKDYDQAHLENFYGQPTLTYSAWLVDQDLSFAIRLEHAFGSKGMQDAIKQSVKEAKSANERYLTHDFNTLFDRIPKSSIITLRSENPHAKQLYIILATADGDKSSDTRAYKRSLEIVKNLPQMLKNATLHLVPTLGKSTYDNYHIQPLIQKANCLKDNRAKIAWIQSVYNALERSGGYGGCGDEGFYLGDKVCVVAPSCPALKDYGEQQEWLEIFFGQGACGDGVKDWYPLPIIYEYKED
ncbi:hypothetical protein [Helicobacter sp. L8]|uniref:hypothetical protein n=1 Tax=Helicobacter sp. L8 TaxID=2316078 RepID=UPI000EB0B437|nr:hypothetical protein [Helicobacter sp. L8]